MTATHPAHRRQWTDRSSPPTGDRPLGRRPLLVGVAVAAGTAVAGCLESADGTPTASDGGGTVPDLPPPIQGDPEAAVTVAVYEDFSCPHCASFNAEVFPRIEATFLEPGNVRYEHHDFPIPVDDWSWPAASAGRAVQDGQGDESFFAYAKRLFESQGQFSLDRLAELAEAVGADGAGVREAAAEETYRPVVEADRAAGVDRGVTGTPTVFVNDDRYVAPSFETLAEAIDAAR